MYVLTTATLVAALVVATTQHLQGILPTHPPTPNPGPTCTTQCDSGTSGGLARRIVDGTFTDPGEYPHMVSLHNETRFDETGSLESSFACGGVVITCKHVLTAAHCHRLCTLPILPVFPLFCLFDLTLPLVVGLNHNNEISDNDPQTQVRRVVHYNIHPGYEPGVIGNDIQILTVAEPFVFDETFKPAYLPNVKLHADDQKVTAIGFGRTSTTDPASAKLRKVELQVVPKVDCSLKYPPTLTAFIALNKILCTEDPGDTKGTCFGDSGSPVFVTCTEGHQVQWGVTAFLVGKCANPDVPSGNTDVSEYRDWIMENTGDMACTKQCTILGY